MGVLSDDQRFSWSQCPMGKAVLDAPESKGVGF